MNLSARVRLRRDQPAGRPAGERGRQAHGRGDRAGGVRHPGPLAGARRVPRSRDEAAGGARRRRAVPRLGRPHRLPRRQFRDAEGGHPARALAAAAGHGRLPRPRPGDDVGAREGGRIRSWY